MMLIKTYIGPSKIQGIGIFAAEPVSKGTPVWKFMSGFDQRIDEKELTRLSVEGRRQFLHYAYHNINTGKYILCFDDARFYNHSDYPTTISTYPNEEDEEGVDVATRDLVPGDEITTNYYEFDADGKNKLQ